MMFTQLAVPNRIAIKLTYPERVTDHNIERLRGAVRRGCDEWPGANFVQNAGKDGFKRFLKFADREAIAANLRIGDTVERHLVDGE